MHPARLAPVFALALAAFAVVALVACSSGQAPGWTYAPPPSVTALPSVAPSDAAAPGSAAPGSAAPGSTAPGSAAPGSAAPSAGTGATDGTLLKEVASGVQFQSTTLEAPAGQPFQIEFDNQDAGIVHDIQIFDASGGILFEGETITGPVKTTYSVPALTAGTYKFACKWHPNMTGQLTAK